MMYKLKENGVINLDTGQNIPNNPANKHWRKYLEWRDQGNNPEPIETLEEKRARRKEEIAEQVDDKIMSMMTLVSAIYEVSLAIYLVDKKDTGLTPEEDAVLDNLRDKFMIIEGYRDQEKQAYIDIDNSDDPDSVTIVLE